MKAKRATPIAAAPTKPEEIPIDRLIVSAEEARKTIDPKALEELAASIRSHGVLEPLLVRPLRAVVIELEDGTTLDSPPMSRERQSEFLAMEGVVRTEVDDTWFEIVAGQRRMRASELAEKTACPCIVREMSDDEARELRIISNLQREDLPPMEEAEAFGKLLETPGATIESIAAALAKSASYVGRRVQLLKAIEPVREALKHGAIEVGHALLLAPLDEAIQRQLLTRMQVGATLIEPEDVEDENAEPGECRYCGCTEDDACDGGCSWANEERTVCTNRDCLDQFREETGQQNGDWRTTHYSVVELRREIENTSFRDLKDAPFPLVADLHPVPCTECPKRAGNAQLLFDDCAQDTCTDRPCFNRKVNAWIDLELAAAKAEKRKLLKLTPNWTSDKDKVRVANYDGARELKAPGECPNGEDGIWIDGSNAGRRAMVCRKSDCKTHRGASRSSSASSTRPKASPAEQAKRKAFLAKLKAEKEYRAALFDAIGAINPLSLAKAGGDVHRKLAARVAEHVLGRSDSTHYGDLARATKIDGAYFGWAKRDELGKHLETLRTEQQILFAAMAIGDSELCVHEHDVPGGGALDKQRKLELETLAETVGIDWKALRKQFAEPNAAKAEKETPAKKAAAKPAKKKSVLSGAAHKRIAEAQKRRWAASRPAKKGAKR